MNKNSIEIGEVFIDEGKDNAFEQYARLAANVQIKSSDFEVNKICYFEVEKKYMRYLCDSRSDAFVIGLITSAMELGCDIYFETPISEKIYFQMTKQYIPIITKYNTYLKCISLNGPFSNEIIENEGAVATGCSGGVDSLATIIEYTQKNVPEKYRLTHGIYTTSSSSRDSILANIQMFKDVLPKQIDLAKDFGLECIGVFNNLFEFYKKPYGEGFNKFYATTYAANSFALQKLIAVYYESAGYSISDFSLKEKIINQNDGSIYDSFSMPNLCSENLLFYCSEMEKERNERIDYIIHNPIVQKKIMTCALPSNGYNVGGKNNCGKCVKCISFLNQAYANNLLDAYNDSFETIYFKNHRGKYWGWFMAFGHHQYVGLQHKELKKNKKHVGISSYIWCYLIYKPYRLVTKLFRNNKLARKVYRKLKLDYKIYGYRLD